MSVTQGLQSPRTPLRRFLDRELSAGPRRLRANYRARLPSIPHLVLPGEGVGGEAGTVGTAIDQRLRLAFTCRAPVDAATTLGVAAIPELACDPLLAGESRDQRQVWEVIDDVGRQLLNRLSTAVGALGLDDRDQPMVRGHEEEEPLARMLLAAAWYALAFRYGPAFPLTPLYKRAAAGPRTFTVEALLALPHRDLVDDVLAQLQAAESSPLAALRATTVPAACLPGPTFDGSADITGDADLIADGVLIEIKSTRRIHDAPLVTLWQLLAYALMDYSDRYRIDAVALYMSRARAFVSWPVEEYLALLGTRRRDLAALRAAFAVVLGYRGCRADDDPLPEQLAGVETLLEEAAPAIADGCCRVCAQPLMSPDLSGVPSRKYCSPWCRTRAPVLRRRGWL